MKDNITTRVFSNFLGRTHPQWKLEQSVFNSQLLNLESIAIIICPSWDPDFELLPIYVFKGEGLKLSPFHQLF